MLRSGHELMKSLWPCGAESSSSSNSRVCLLNMTSGPVILERQVELQVLEVAVASENDT